MHQPIFLVFFAKIDQYASKKKKRKNKHLQSKFNNFECAYLKRENFDIDEKISLNFSRNIKFCKTN